MAHTGRGILKGVIIVVVGALIGTMVGELLGAYLPDGGVKSFFLKSLEFGLQPATLNLYILVFTIGLMLKLNVMTVIGIIGAALILRKL